MHLLCAVHASVSLSCAYVDLHTHSESVLPGGVFYMHMYVQC